MFDVLIESKKPSHKGRMAGTSLASLIFHTLVIGGAVYATLSAGPADDGIKVDTALVQVPVLVTTKDGQFIPGLKEGNFRVFEDGVPQRITKFEISQAPITAVLVVEFASRNYNFVYDALNASYVFAQTLKPEDWIAVVSYDMKPQIWQDFTQDKNQMYAALGHLRIPGFSETNLFDALYRRGNTIILVTHELDIALHAYRVIRLLDGKVAADETVRH